MAERERISRFFAPLAAGEPGGFNLTDDAAVLAPPPGFSLVVTTDSVIEGIHVLPGASAAQFAQKLMRRNLSDLAAMGALPWRYTLNLHTPATLAESWFSEFSVALAEEQTQFGMALVGGDSTAAEAAAIHTTMTCFGLLDGAPLRRNGAQVGDDIYVSGTIGDAALGLKLLQHKLQQFPGTMEMLTERYHTPQPRLALGLGLHGIASAVMDISDGLMADVGQLCAASNVGARIQRAAIPRSAALQHYLDADAAIWNLVLNGGDDYELCFTASPALRERIAALSQQLALPLTRIGEVTREREIVLLDASGKALANEGAGWEYR